MLVVHPASCCDVCLDPYSISSGPANSPHAIACGHIFCLTCLRSLSLSACPLCREPFRPDSVKKLYIANPSKRDVAEQDTIDDQHANLLLRRMSLVSGEDTPDAEVVKVVTEVQEWLKSHSDNPNSHKPLRAAVASLQRVKVLQDQGEREKVECRRLRDKLRTCKLYADLDSKTSRAVEEGLLSRIQKLENEHALKLSQLHSQLEILVNPQPRHPSTNNPIIPQPVHLHRTVDLDTHIRRGHNIVFLLITFFGIIEFAISAWLTSQFDVHDNYFSLAGRDCTNFLLFTSTWTIIFSSYRMFFFFPPPDSVLGSMASHIFFLCLTWVFWTAGAASITAVLGGQLNRNAQSLSVYCGQLIALDVFAWVILVLVTFAIFVVHTRDILASGRGDGVRGPQIA
ncbi:hypothetical protein F4604DRAFT_738348 [Suillus subluteus]|nr:hypothetical protein F4604DRAFT_738348 [Suillus subluteus]